MLFRRCFFLVFCLLLFSSIAWAGAMEHLWSQHFGDASDQCGISVAVDGSGNAIVIGQIQGTVDFGGGPLVSAGSNDISLAKFDPNGNHLWSQRFGDSNDQRGYSVTVDGSGNIVVTGFFRGTLNFGGGPLVSAGNYDIYVAKFDPSGTHLWSQRFGDSSDQIGASVAIDGSGNIIITGHYWGTVDFGGGPLVSAGLTEIFVVKFDPGGTHLWSQRFGDSNQEYGFRVSVDASGNTVMTGSFKGTVDFGGGQLVSAGGYDVFVVKFDPGGTHLWSRRFGDSADQLGYRSAVDGSGNTVATGIFKGTVDFGGGPLVSAGDYDIFVVKFDPGGTHLWSRRFGDSSIQIAYPIGVDDSGNAVVAAHFQGTVDFGGGPLVSAGGYDIGLAKFDPGGAHLWSQRFGGSADQVTAYDIDTDGSDYVIFAGHFRSTVDFGGGMLTSAGGLDICVVKFELAKGSIAGRVAADCPAPDTGLPGVSVDAYVQGNGDLVGTAVTDENGNYQIDELATGDYTMTIVTPLGYTAAADEIPVTVLGGEVAEVDFALSCIEITPSQRSIGFWKHQVGVALGGKGHGQIDGATLCDYLDLIEAHFNSNEINQVVIYVPPVSGVCDDKLGVAKDLLNLKGNVGMTARAKQQLMALLLNVAAGKLSLTEIISENGATVSQAITYCDNLIDDPSGDHEKAKTIADAINNGEMVPTGVIPTDTPNIGYSPPVDKVDVPECFSLGQNYPNPFNPNTVIEYTVPAAGEKVTLKIYDVNGRLVRTLVDGYMAAGLRTASWDGKDSHGRSVSTGIYFYQLKAKGFAETRKMMLIK